MLKKILNSEIVPDRINLGLLVLRLSVSGMMLTHGFPKFLKLINGDLGFADPLGLGSGFTLVVAVSAEFLGSLMILSGFGTRIGALLGASTMAVAGFIHHADDPFGTKEKALLYLTCYIVLIISGSGKYSVESKLT